MCGPGTDRDDCGRDRASFALVLGVRVPDSDPGESEIEAYWAKRIVRTLACVVEANSVVVSVSARCEV